MKTVSFGTCAFVFFMINSAWTLSSIVAVVVNGAVIDTTEARMNKLGISAEEDRLRHVEELVNEFNSIVADSNGISANADVEELPSDRQKANRITKHCSVQGGDVTQVLYTLSA